MPRKVHVPSLRLHAPTGQARVLIRGRHVYLGRYGSPEAEEKYRRLVAEYLATGGVTPAPSEPAKGDGLTVNELVLAYWRHAERYYRKHGRPTSELSTFKTPLRVLRRLYGSTPAAEFGPLKLKAVREELLRDSTSRATAGGGERKSRGQCRSTANRSVGRIRRMFAWAAENELVPATVLHGLKSVAGLRKGRTAARESAPVRPVDEADVNAVLPHVSRQVRDMIRLQLLSGCRPGEVIAIRPCDLVRDGGVWEYVPESHKTEHHGRDRRIFFGPRAQAILAAYLDDRPAEAYCFSPAEAEAERLAARHAARKTPLSCGNRPGSGSRSRRGRPPGGRYTLAAYRRAIERGCRAAEVVPWGPNRLRHARATDLRRRYGIEAAQTVLGHAELEVTQVYAERDFAAARRIMAEVG
ncbi:MAG TPA: site-specific integrase [Planctomycetaceae bacterium]